MSSMLTPLRAEGSEIRTVKVTICPGAGRVALTDFTTRGGVLGEVGVPGGEVVGVLGGGVGVVGESGELLIVTSCVKVGPASFPSI
jgi:hypothetical protein